MRIEALDLTDEAALAEYYRLYRDYMEHDRADQPVLHADAIRAVLAAPRPDMLIEHWGARDADGNLIGYFDMLMPQRENLANLHSMGWVHPRHRRRGVATAMFGHLSGRARHHGRDNVTVMVHESVPGGTMAHSPAGPVFCERMGLNRALVEPRRRLDLATVDAAALAALEASARDKAAGYTTLTWTDRADDALAADLARLEGRLRTDVPTGELQWEPEVYDVERWRSDEDMGRDRKRTIYYAAARDGESGRLAAYTALILPLRPRTHGAQQTTVVDPGHRGRRLGLLVKLANLESVRRAEPELSCIDTTNADDNEHMIAINEAMGFTVRDAAVHFQGPV